MLSFLFRQHIHRFRHLLGIDCRRTHPARRNRPRRAIYPRQLQWLSSVVEGQTSVALTRRSELARPLALPRPAVHGSVRVFPAERRAHAAPETEGWARTACHDGARAAQHAVGDGVRCIVRMRNITRVRRAANIVGSLQAALHIARAHARRRGRAGASCRCAAARRGSPRVAVTVPRAHTPCVRRCRVARAK